MSKLNLTLTSVLAIAGFAGGTLAASEQAYPDAIASHDELTMQQLAERMFLQLPREQQVQIAQQGGLGSEPYSDQILSDDHSHEAPSVSPDITAAEYLDLIVSEDLAARLSEEQWNILNAIVESLDAGKLVPHMCFSPDTDPERQL
jgi:hypothetical protein